MIIYQFFPCKNLYIAKFHSKYYYSIAGKYVTDILVSWLVNSNANIITISLLIIVYFCFAIVNNQSLTVIMAEDNIRNIKIRLLDVVTQSLVPIYMLYN